MTSVMGANEWADCCERLGEWAEHINPRMAFERLADVLREEHFGDESVRIAGREETFECRYLNMGDSYDTTILLCEDPDSEWKLSLAVGCWADWLTAAETKICQDDELRACHACGTLTCMHAEECGACGSVAD